MCLRWRALLGAFAVVCVLFSACGIAYARYMRTFTISGISITLSVSDYAFLSSAGGSFALTVELPE